jgi:hypothetical protein
MYWLDLLKCAIEPAKYSVQTTSSVQSVKTPLKPYLGFFKKIETTHTNSASIDMHFDKI